MAALPDEQTAQAEGDRDATRHAALADLTSIVVVKTDSSRTDLTLRPGAGDPMLASTWSHSWRGRRRSRHPRPTSSGLAMFGTKGFEVDKAMGMNLTEYSSGEYQGRLHISKRGSAAVRRWMYFAALRWIRNGPGRRWYLRKRARDQEGAKRALMGVMRKLAKGLHYVGTTGELFQPARLFSGRSSRSRKVRKASLARRS